MIDKQKMFDCMDAVAEGIKAGIKMAAPVWIPVSERLPECRKRVLVSDLHGVFVAVWIGDGWNFEPAEIGMCTSQSAILAWMPLPEPYKK